MITMCNVFWNEKTIGKNYEKLKKSRNLIYNKLAISVHWFINYDNCTILKYDVCNRICCVLVYGNSLHHLFHRFPVNQKLY